MANLYYNQPLLAAMATSFGVPERAIGAIPTFTQLGYGLGMLVLVPLGDRFERRGLILAMCALSVVALLVVATAPSVAVLVPASLALGLTSMTPQYLVPYAAAAAAPHERGHVVGTVMSGLLVGILLSRTVAGVLADGLGWRAVYLVAAAAMVALTVVLRRYLPAQRTALAVPLRQLYASLWTLARREPVLRLHAFIGALTFAAFSIFWSTLAFQVAAPPLSRGAGVAGAFGVIGVVGALAAPLVGRFADRRDPRIVNAAAMCTVLVSFGLFGAFGSSLVGLAAGVVLLDLGVQANHISNQARIFGLDPTARNRLNTVYMSVYFAGGALGSLLGAYAWSAAGWRGVSLAGAGCAAAALLVFALGRKARPALGASREIA